MIATLRSLMRELARELASLSDAQEAEAGEFRAYPELIAPLGNVEISSAADWKYFIQSV